VLNGIDLDILSGNLTLLMGPSGCGKTTMVSIMAGITSPDAGSVSVFGTPLSSLSKAETVRFRATTIGLVPQQINLVSALTVAENTALPLLALGVPLGKAARQIESLLESLEIAEHRNKRPAELSVGQQQRVAIARSLAHKPKLIICDEPTAALDAATGTAVMRLLYQEVVSPGQAVVVVTHDPRIEPWADAVIQMRDGRIISVDRMRQEEEAA
jgi:putative ABC transport system ATP-binding protein